MMGEYSIASLLAAFFYQYRHLSLPGLGKFRLNEDVDLSDHQHKRYQLPAGSVQFISNPREEADLELIKFITERTRKMKSLALADLFTLTEQAREMLNIGQPVSFEGIGTLTRSLKGEYEFRPGVFEAHAISTSEEGADIPAYPISDVVSQEDLQTKTERPGRSSGGIAIIIVCLAIVALLVYFMVIHQSTPSTNAASEQEAVITPEIPVSDTQAVHKPVIRKGMLHYEIVFEKGNKGRALWRYDQLTGWGHHVIMRTRDSITYTVSVPFTTQAADTTAMKDSIRILYGHPVYILYENDLTGQGASQIVVPSLRTPKGGF